MEACRLLGGCKSGQAKITPGFRLRASHVIHTVGPVWRGGEEGEPELLASCYRSSLAIARERQLRVVAFPGISTGIFGYPLEAAAAVAVRAVVDFLNGSEWPEAVWMCTFGVEATSVMRAAIAAVHAE